MKILLVSDLEHFATKNVFEDYLAEFQRAGIDVVPFRMYDLRGMFTPQLIWSMMYAQIMYKVNGITHVLFVTGTNIHKDMIDSIDPKIKVGVIGTDDPHSSKAVVEAFQNRLDYYFTNEKKLEGYSDVFHYLPIASGRRIPTNITLDYTSDICFVGTVYPNRAPVLEKVCRWALENGKKPLFVGPHTPDAKTGFIKPYSKEIITNNIEAMKYMMGAKVSINIDRDVKWRMNFKDNPGLLDVGEPYSNNPRAYEIPLNKSVQLFINPRQEAIDLFGDSIFVADNENIEEVLLEIFGSSKSHIEGIKNRAYGIALHHTYGERVKTIIKILMEEKND